MHNINNINIYIYKKSMEIPSSTRKCLVLSSAKPFFRGTSPWISASSTEADMASKARKAFVNMVSCTFQCELFAVCLVKMNPINLKDLADRWYVVLMKCHFNKFNIFQYVSICFDMLWLFHTTAHINPEWNHHDSASKWQPMLDLNSHRWWICGSTPLTVTTGPSFDRIHWLTLINLDIKHYQPTQFYPRITPSPAPLQITNCSFHPCSNGSLWLPRPEV